MENTSNINKLKKLIIELENEPFFSQGYKQILFNIKSVIIDEEQIIKNLNKEKDKIYHYKNICDKIINILDNTKELSFV